jgi:isopenicillin N synthase-like dioxygenase
MNIPLVDLSQFINGNKEQQSQFVKELGKAFEEVGFVSVMNHGISSSLISDLYSVVEHFFNLPVESKLKYEIAGLAGQRGYTSFGKEHAKGSNAADLKEFFQYGQTIEPGQHTDEDYVPNVMVDEINNFNTLFLQAYSAFELSGSYLLKAIALHLGLEENYFDQHIHLGNSILRAIHSPNNQVIFTSYALNMHLEFFLLN